jgi:undecaprenyl-diphosphatase
VQTRRPTAAGLLNRLGFASRRLGRAARALEAADIALYRAVANTPSPALDRRLTQLSNAANYSVLWLSIAAGLAVFGGRRARRAAALGVASIGVTSLTANALVKPLLVRSRPDRIAAGVPEARYVRMPTSTSFPSGHAASAFAFATVVGRELPATAVPLHLLALGVAYSRVYTGVHYPSDVVVGSLIGVACGSVVRRVARRHRP